jgi:O-antigen ligase
MATSAMASSIRVRNRQPRASGEATVTGARSAHRLVLALDPLRLLMFLLTIITISQVHQHYPFLMKLRPALLLVVGAAGYAYLNPRKLTHVNVLELWPMRLIVVLGILACCSTVFGISLGRSAIFILNVYMKVVVYAFLLALSVRHARDLFTFVWAYVVGCGILAFFSLFVFGIARTNSGFARLDHLYMYDANDLGVIMMIGLPLTLLLLSVSRGARKLVLLVLLVGIAATVARSGSRGGFLGFAAVGLAGLLLANGVSVGKRIVLLVAAPLALALGAPAGYWKQMGTVLEPKADYNYSTIDGRKAVAERGIGYMVSYPIFGIGVDNFSRAECTISPKLKSLSRNGPVRCTAPHNSYVQAGAELGVPGLLVWLSLELGLIISLLRLRRRLPRKWTRGTDVERFLYATTTFFPIAMIGFAVTSFFVSFAWMEPLYIMAAFTAGVSIALREYSRTSVIALDTGVPTSVVRGQSGWRVAMSARHLQVPIVAASASRRHDA